VIPILVDTGFLVAFYDTREPYHRRCKEIYGQLDRPLATCEPAVAESLYLLQKIPDAAKGILASIEDGALEIPFKLAESAVPVAKLMEKYRDTPADFADACLIHMADQLDTGDILTLDSDFKHYRWRRNRRFRMLIPLD
jgi:uncharacterized protein